MSKNHFEISDLDYTSNQVIVDFAKKMQKRGLHACGISGREESGKILDFKVSFQYGQILDIPDEKRFNYRQALVQHMSFIRLAIKAKMHTTLTI